MKTILLPCLLLLTGMLSAADKGTKCIMADGGAQSVFTFLVTDVVKFDEHVLERHPVVVINDAGRPVSLEWHAKEPNTKASSEKVGEVNGRELRLFLFWQKDGNKDGDGLVCAWFGIQRPVAGGHGFRPFLVFEGDDQIRWWDWTCNEASEKEPEITLGYTVKGTGVYWDRHFVGFDANGPKPLRIESGGRNLEETIRNYR